MVNFLSSSLQGCYRLCKRLHGECVSLADRVKNGLTSANGTIRNGSLAALGTTAVLTSAPAANAAGFEAFSDYSNLGVDASVLFPIIINGLTSVLLPMVVFSIALGVIYMLWSFARSKAFGHA